MRDADETLRELRRLFRDEVEDALGPLDDARAALSDAGAAGAHAGAVDEVFRIVHSLKGAARAVAWPSIERFCHVLETRLGAAREGHVPAARCADDAGLALVTLRACVSQLDDRGAPDDDALARAMRQLDAAPAPPARPPVAAPAAPAAPPVMSAPATSPPAVEETARVPLARLHALVGAAEELAVAAARLDDRALLDALEGAIGEARAAARRAPGGAEDVVRPLAAALAAIADRRRVSLAERRTTALAGDEVLVRAREMRVQQVGTVAPALERAAHDAAAALGREVDFALEGGLVELDRRVLDGLREPLLHLVRNAVDHGVEAPDERRRAGKPPRGSVRVVVAGAGQGVTFTVRDDGRGVDASAALEAARARRIHTAGVRDPFQLLFEPGVTTRRDVTELSGRGVGLDVVRQRVARLHGHVRLESEVGRGTAVTMTVPVDLSVTRALFAQAGDAAVALVTTAVVRVRRVGPDDVRTLGGARHLLDDGRLVPLSSLAEVLGLAAPGASPTAARRPCVVVAAGERRAAFLVDELGEERDVVARALGARVRRAPFVAATVLRDDGEVALLLDAGDLVGLAAPSVEAPAAPRAAQRRVLVVDDSVTTRQLLRSILEAAGYLVTVAADGLAAWALLAGDARFDAVVTDVEMPRMDGWQLLARLRGEARTARLPVVVVTALSQAGEQQRAVALGASAYVAKGRFDQAELLHVLEQLVQ